MNEMSGNEGSSVSDGRCNAKGDGFKSLSFIFFGISPTMY